MNKVKKVVAFQGWEHYSWNLYTESGKGIILIYERFDSDKAMAAFVGEYFKGPFQIPDGTSAEDIARMIEGAE